MVLSRGIIRLSRHQAEGRRSEFAPLCLKYIMCIIAAATAFAAWLKNYNTAYGYALIAAAAVIFMLLIHLRTLLNYRIYRMSASYLKRSDEVSHTDPTGVQLFGFGITLLSVKAMVITILLSPAALCLKFALHSFSLSGERGQFMLMLGASFFLLLSGIIFSAIIPARFDCAEYLFFSGQCGSAFSALENSWMITRGCCGDRLMLNFRLIFCGFILSSLSRCNLSARLIKNLDKRSRGDLYFEIDSRAEVNSEYAAQLH